MERGTKTQRRGGTKGRSIIASAALAALVLGSASVLADDVDQPRRGAPSLDELLGLPQVERASARGDEEAARREADEALRRRLEEGRQTASFFAQAIEQMIVSADLLDARFDPGVGTQRVQEDIIAKLTHLIDQACQQCAQSSSSSGSSAQRQSQRQQPQPQEQSQGERESEARDGEGDQEGVPPGFQQGDVHAAIAETRAEWGALPERIREMLLQGRQERFSSLYEQLTRDYYRRLASE